MKVEYTCVDCGFVGKLNTEITYRGEEYICWQCLKKWQYRIYGRHNYTFKIFGHKININIWAKEVS